MGRHDLRFWSGTTWTEHVADGYITAVDPLFSGVVAPAAIRPSWHVWRKKFGSLPAWRWAIALPCLVLAPFFAYAAGGWLLAAALTAFGVLCVVFLPLLYFNVMLIAADGSGLTIRNQLGFKRFVPREQIAAVSVGKAWSGGLRSADYAFIVSASGGQLGRFFLDLWDPADFGRLAHALGLELYGRPGRRLDQQHSGRNDERIARFYTGSTITGALLGCALVIIPIVAIVVAVLVVSHR